MNFDEFGAFYANHKGRCLRATVASGVDPARAEDAVAEAFARAWARWRTIRNARSPAAWVVRTAVKPTSPHGGSDAARSAHLHQALATLRADLATEGARS